MGEVQSSVAVVTSYVTEEEEVVVALVGWVSVRNLRLIKMGIQMIQKLRYNPRANTSNTLHFFRGVFARICGNLRKITE